jgi:hypothetical protein
MGDLTGFQTHPCAGIRTTKEMRMNAGMVKSRIVNELRLVPKLERLGNQGFMG